MGSLLLKAKCNLLEISGQTMANPSWLQLVYSAHTLVQGHVTKPASYEAQQVLFSTLFLYQDALAAMAADLLVAAAESGELESTLTEVFKDLTAAMGATVLARL